MFGALAAYYPVLKARIGADDALFGLVLLFPAAGALAAMLLAPQFERRTGRWALLIGMLFMAALFQPPMWASGVWVFAVLMLFAGACAGLLDVVMNARLSSVEAQVGRSLMNFNHAMFSFAYAGSAICAGLAREAGLGPEAVFAVLLVLIAAVAHTTVPPKLSTASAAAPERKGRLPVAVLWGGLIVMTAFLCENATEGWGALHIERTLGGGAAEGAFGPAMLGLTMGIGRMAGQVVTARWSETRLLIWASVLAATGAAIAAIAPVPLVAYAGFGALGLGVSVVAPIALALVGRAATDDNRVRVISRTAALGYFGFFIGPPAMGGMAALFGLRASFGMIALLLLLAVILVTQLRRSIG